MTDVKVKVGSRTKRYKKIPGAPLAIYREAALRGVSPRTIAKQYFRVFGVKHPRAAVYAGGRFYRIKAAPGVSAEQYRRAALAASRGHLARSRMSRYARALAAQKAKKRMTSSTKGVLSRVSAAKRFSSYFKSRTPYPHAHGNIDILSDPKKFFAPIIKPLLKNPEKDYSTVVRSRSKLERDLILSISGTLREEEVCRFYFKGASLAVVKRFLNSFAAKASRGVLQSSDIPSSDVGTRHPLSKKLMSGSRCDPATAINGSNIAWRLNSAAYLPSW